MVKLLLLALALALLAAPSAFASDRLALNASHVRLAVSKDGARALVTYSSAGKTRHALVWGASDARPPSQTVPQVRFKIDWTGGWATYGHTIWQHFGNACRPYDGPALAALVAACTAPDGSFWALQAWQPKLPHRGYPPYKAGQTDWELDVSHWSGELAQLEVHADWAFNGQAHNLFGRLLYRGVPVHGFHTVKGTGAPQTATGAASTSTRSTRRTAPAGSARRRSSSATRPVSSVTRSGRHTTCRCRDSRRGPPGSARRTASR